MRTMPDGTSGGSQGALKARTMPTVTPENKEAPKVTVSPPPMPATKPAPKPVVKDVGASASTEKPSMKKQVS